MSTANERENNLRGEFMHAFISVMKIVGLEAAGGPLHRVQCVLTTS